MGLLSPACFTQETFKVAGGTLPYCKEQFHSFQHQTFSQESAITPHRKTKDNSEGRARLQLCEGSAVVTHRAL